MSLEGDYFLDRRKLKRKLLSWRILAILSLAIVAISFFVDTKTLSSVEHIARLKVSGIIVDDLDRELVLRDLKADDNVVALIVRIDSPGGTVVGGQSLYNQLKDLSEDKPVVAVMGSTATSAGYMVALGADHVIAREGSLTGSIGVLLQTADVTELLKRLGIKSEAIKSGSLKAQPNPLETTTPEARQAIKRVVMDMHSMFVDMVVERRKIPIDDARVLGDGRVYTGRQALANGLIDGIGSEIEALDWLTNKAKIPKGLLVKDVIIERTGHNWRALIGKIIGKLEFSDRLRLDGLISLWHPEL